MNFVEQWLGFSPDSGNGIVEACIVLAAVTIICIFAFRGKIQTAFYKCMGSIAGAR